MEHRIKAPCNKHYISKEGGGMANVPLNVKKNYTHREENKHPFVSPNYRIESKQHPVTKENIIYIEKNKK